MSYPAFGYGLLYTCLAALIIFLNLLPLDGIYRYWAGPELLLCLTLAWVMRRPDTLPYLLIACVFLCADLVLIKPIGLSALLALIATQVLRRMTMSGEQLTAFEEMAQIAMALTLIFLSERIALWLLFSPRPDLLAHGGQLLLTVLYYPLVALMLQFVFGLKRLSSAEIDRMNRGI